MTVGLPRSSVTPMPGVISQVFPAVAGYCPAPPNLPAGSSGTSEEHVVSVPILGDDGTVTKEADESHLGEDEDGKIDP